MGKIAKNFEDYMEALRKADTAHWQSEKIPCEKDLYIKWRKLVESLQGPDCDKDDLEARKWLAENPGKSSLYDK